jgi:cytochrome c peroxidase
MFTDLSYRTLAVPRNWKIPYNIDATAQSALAAIGQTGLLNGAALGAPGHKYYDLGFCGPFRTDSLGDAALCGAFRVPGLRNVALKSSYEHNGVFSSLTQVIDFYVNRDVTPQKFYLKADGSPDIAYNDLPVIYQGNREIRPPFTPPRAGVRLNAADVQDLIAFLCTLTDGFDPAQPQTYRLPQQCRQAIRP